MEYTGKKESNNYWKSLAKHLDDNTKETVNCYFN
jgi:hypothetical protein